MNLIICILLNAACYMSVSTLAGDTICNMAYVRCMQAKLTRKVAGLLNVAGDTMTYNSPIRCCTARSQATPNVASAGARSSSGLSLAGGDELTRAMELIILIDVDSPRVSWVGFTNFTFTFYVHLSSLCVWILSFALCLYNVTFYMWLIKCSLVARN